MGSNTTAISSASGKYTRVARVLHWAMAVPIIGLLVFGEETMGSHASGFLPSLHASLGLLLVALVLFRLFWRIGHRPPNMSNGTALEKLAARFAHIALYAAMLLIPITGWLAYTEHVRRTLGVHTATWFSFKIPLLPDFGFNWHLLHNWGGKLVLALIALHAAAALKHHFYNKDDTLKRMLP